MPFEENRQVLEQYTTLLHQHRDLNHPEIKQYFDENSSRNIALFILMTTINEIAVRRFRFKGPES